ncbi:MAG: hypothetical protein AAFU83_04185, partial [Bacteroidota bacterium]
RARKETAGRLQTEWNNLPHVVLVDGVYRVRRITYNEFFKRGSKEEQVLFMRYGRPAHESMATRWSCPPLPNTRVPVPSKKDVIQNYALGVPKNGRMGFLEPHACRLIPDPQPETTHEVAPPTGVSSTSVAQLSPGPPEVYWISSEEEGEVTCPSAEQVKVKEEKKDSLDEPSSSIAPPRESVKAVRSDLVTARSPEKSEPKATLKSLQKQKPVPTSAKLAACLSKRKTMDTSNEPSPSSKNDDGPGTSSSQAVGTMAPLVEAATMVSTERASKEPEVHIVDAKTVRMAAERSGKTLMHPWVPLVSGKGVRYTEQYYEDVVQRRMCCSTCSEEHELTTSLRL